VKNGSSPSVSSFTSATPLIQKIERNARTRLAEMAIAKWRRFVRRRKAQRGAEASNRSTPSTAGPAMLQVVEEAMTAAAKCPSYPNADTAAVADETTSLL
jgi:hypothetical protein